MVIHLFGGVTGLRAPPLVEEDVVSFISHLV